MTPRQLQAALDTVGLSQRRAGPFLGYSERTIRHWIAGDWAVPQAPALLLQVMILWHISVEEIEKLGKLGLQVNRL